MRFPTYHGTELEDSGMLALALGLVTVGVVALLVRRFRPFVVVVAGESMAPVLMPGDFLLATSAGRVARGALIVAEDPRKPGFDLVKRVAGVPGDIVESARLGAGEHWLLGERPESSTDSRTFGAVARDGIKGIVRLRYWPPDRFSVFG